MNQITKDGEELGKVYVLNNITTFQEKDIAKTNVEILGIYILLSSEIMFREREREKKIE